MSDNPMLVLAAFWTLGDAEEVSDAVSGALDDLTGDAGVLGEVVVLPVDEIPDPVLHKALRYLGMRDVADRALGSTARKAGGLDG